MRYFFIIIAALLIHSCKGKDKPPTLEEKQKELETGSLDTASIYSAGEIGWTAHIPAGWEIVTKKQLEENTEKGKKAMEESIDAEIDASGLQQLLNLRKDKFNAFLSTLEKYDVTEMDSYEENNKLVYDVVKQTYKGQGIQARYSEDSAMIDGLRFHAFKIKIYSPDQKEVLLNQVIYSRLINGYDVGLTISYNNEGDRKELEEMLFSSKFSKRD